MTPLSDVCSVPSLRLLALATGLAALSACASEPASSATPKPVVQPKPVCSAPPPIPDIWKLEPLLLEQGKITAEMSREQREQAIREYIRAKNERFLKDCQVKK